MTVFWLLLGLLTILAIAFAITPLLGTSKIDQTSPQSKELNIDITKRQLAELDRDLQDGLLDTTEYSSAKTDLERTLLQNVETATSKLGDSHKKPVLTIALLAISLPLVAALTYWKTGVPQLATYDPSAVQQQQTNQQPHQQQQHSQDPTEADFNQMISGLEAKLQQDPDDVEGWLMLAKTYQVLKQLDNARDAYSQVLRLQPENTRALVSYADILAITGGGTVAGQPYEMVLKALKIDPTMVEARWLAGIAETEMGNLDNALGYWVPLQQQLAQSRPELAAELGKQIDNAKTTLGGTSTIDVPGKNIAQNAAQKPESSTANVKIIVTVKLADALQQLVSADDTVFVYAKAMQGPGMPLAAKKIKVSDLPITITLDDSMAMMPQMTLSSFDLVKVGARVSRSGQATATTGDLSGEQINIKPGQQDQVNIVINSVL